MVLMNEWSSPVRRGYKETGGINERTNLSYTYKETSGINERTNLSCML